MKYKIIFFHGFNSSNETNKFEAIKFDKICHNFDYSRLSYAEADKLHSKIIEQELAEPGISVILVGHSLGGYWALKKSMQYKLAVVLINPQLFPDRSDIRDVDKYELTDTRSNPKFAYIETGDEVIDVKRTISYLADKATMKLHEGGHHRIQHLEEINNTIRTSMNEKV